LTASSEAPGAEAARNAPPETIHVPAGLLTRARESDAEQVAQSVAQNLAHLRPWMPWANEASADAEFQRGRCRDCEDRWADGSEYIYVLRRHPGGPVIGTFGLHRRVGPGAIEIGYWVHVSYTGQGYATSAAAALTRAGLALSDVTRVEIHTDEANVISAAIPRRLGYRLDRVEARAPEAEAETGRLQIWIKTSADPVAPAA
jgi:RimJ/RimL family protein N-acetyltransferase